jgi:hypothetical protein
LDSDDVWLPGKLAQDRRWLAACLDKETACLYGRFLYQGPGYRIIGPRREYRGPVTLRDLLRHGGFGMSNVVVQKCALEAVEAFDEEVHVLEDWDLWLRFASAGFKIDHTSAIGAVFYQSPDSLTLDLKRGEQQMFSILGSFFQRQDLPSEVRRLEEHARSWGLLRLAAAQMGRLRMDHVRKYLGRAWREQPRACLSREAVRLLLGSALGSRLYAGLRDVKRWLLSPSRPSAEWTAIEKNSMGS